MALQITQGHGNCLSNANVGPYWHTTTLTRMGTTSNSDGTRGESKDTAAVLGSRHLPPAACKSGNLPAQLTEDRDDDRSGDGDGEEFHLATRQGSTQRRQEKQKHLQLQRNEPVVKIFARLIAVSEARAGQQSTETNTIISIDSDCELSTVLNRTVCVTSDGLFMGLATGQQQSNIT